MRGQGADGDHSRLQLLAGGGLLALAGLGGLLSGLRLTGGARDVAGLVLSIGVLAGGALVYEAMCHWNRLRDHRFQDEEFEPGDRLNGLAAVIMVMAFATLAHVAAHGPARGTHLLATQASGLRWGVAVVVAGTVLTVSPPRVMLRNPRLGLFALSFLAAFAVEAQEVFRDRPDPALSGLVWVAVGGLALLVAAAGEAGRDPGTQRPASPMITASGTLVVALADFVMLGVQGWLLPTDGLALVYGGVVVVAVSIRFLRLVQDLEHLARTRRQALTDDLTGLANRRALLAGLEEALTDGGTVTLLLIDLDRFKVINDRYGHAVGDDLLRHVTSIFATHVPDDALLARLGGDEFAVLLPDAAPGQGVDLAAAMAHAAAPLSDVKGRLLQVGASVGVTWTTTGATTSGVELMRRADAAMYLAKGRGGGVQVYDESVDAAARERLHLTDDLHRILQDPAGAEELQVYFQPQVGPGGSVVGAEALIRWHHPTLGVLPPGRFLDLAEENALMDALTDRALRVAAAQARRWRELGHPTRVAVNLSAGSLGRSQLLPLLDDVLAGGLPPEDLILEITETTLMSDPDVALEAVRAIARRGVGISIDDYGTGYSSLAYLNDLPATELKIDRSFTGRVLNDPRTVAIVAGTVELARHLGLRLVAEGVEDEETRREMERLGCDVTQGYLHTVPLPAEEFVAWLERHSARAGLPIP